MKQRSESGSGRAGRIFGFLQPVAHRPPLNGRFWVYSAAAYLMPVVVHVALPAEGTSLDEIVWLVTLVPAFLLSLHYGLRGAFVALVVGTALLLGVQLFQLATLATGDTRVTVPIYIAYGAMAISVGWLSEQLHDFYEAALELQAAQKTEALGTMAAGIAHDFNNILTGMVANAELIAAELDSESEAGASELELLKEQARRGAGIARNMLGFSRRGMLALRPLDLVQAMEEVMKLVGRLVPEPIDLRFVGDDGLPSILADRDAVERIVVNLVTNARDAMPYGGSLDVSVRMCQLDGEHGRRTGWGDPGEYVCLTVTDSGTGMDEETVSRIFDPFFTGKAPGEGVGLGMAMVYGLMKQHRGFVDVQSAPGEGTRVRIYFPVAKTQLRVPTVERTGAPAGGSETILLVEDDEPIRRAAQRVLERLGYSVITAADGEEAVQLYRERRGEVDLVLTDVVLPKRTGPELYEAIRTRAGDPRVLFMSGYPARTVQANAKLDPALPFLQKPWTTKDLAAAVRAALEYTGSAVVREALSETAPR